MMRMRSQRARILAWTSVTMVAILVVVVAGGYAAIRLELSGITHVSKIDTRQRPPRYNNALNILLLGSDTRTGRNGAIGGRSRRLTAFLLRARGLSCRGSQPTGAPASPRNWVTDRKLYA